MGWRFSPVRELSPQANQQFQALAAELNRRGEVLYGEGSPEGRYEARLGMAAAYSEAYRRYCWPVSSVDDFKLAPFHVLATEGAVHANKSHGWHMETIADLCGDEPGLFDEEPRVEEHSDGHEEKHRERVTQWQRISRGLVAHIGFANDDAGDERAVAVGVCASRFVGEVGAQCGLPGGRIGDRDETAGELLVPYDGLLVPGGFGVRGVEGMVDAIRWAREHKLPFLGICLGLQVAIVEFARHVCKLPNTNSSEFEPECENPVIALLASQQGIQEMGGTMRLGAYPCRLRAGSRVAQIYGAPEVSERHRHRYEVSNAYRDVLAEYGMRCSGLSPDGSLVEIIELPDHPWYVGCQFHPELKSRPTRPHPLFAAFVEASYKHKTQGARSTVAHGVELRA